MKTVYQETISLHKGLSSFADILRVAVKYSKKEKLSMTTIFFNPLYQFSIEGGGHKVFVIDEKLLQDYPDLRGTIFHENQSSPYAAIREIVLILDEIKKNGGLSTYRREATKEEEEEFYS